MGKKPFFALALVAAIIAVSGCTVSSTPLPVSDSVRADVVSYASPIMDSMMIGMNSGNYDMFSANFSDVMKTSIDSEKFAQLSYTLQATIGKYMSKESGANVDEVDGYYRAVFTAHFTDDDPVSVTMSFKKSGGEHKVEGLWFSSKKLLGKT